MLLLFLLKIENQENKSIVEKSREKQRRSIYLSTYLWYDIQEMDIRKKNETVSSFV